eukprot:CAMPEP_0205898372 /NCGR_PEP_ID=MMETSP1083-20121108/26015_1 /ASSEMBLY_ACC=CAM_ASM_000430 /TAXON_ID=97485 /ORGANISM="Prymnesium parvum, Strain Texoma1" /LENGTH=86 /DNA_ID=CAMNT_0053263633 /DNA_START=309 /DNA_END=567 /DNA_ORIENTATION=+
MAGSTSVASNATGAGVGDTTPFHEAAAQSHALFASSSEVRAAGVGAGASSAGGGARGAVLHEGVWALASHARFAASSAVSPAGAAE